MNLDEIFTAAGCTGFAHAITLDGGNELGHRPDDPVVPASVIKVLVALEAETRMADGRLEPAERVLLRADRRTTGPTGFSLFRDAVEVSVRDLPVLMLTISDNVCTDALLQLIGLDEVNATAQRLGLHHTVLASTLADLIDSLTRDTGFDDWAAFAAWSDVEADPEALAAADERLHDAGGLQPGSPTRTTARDMTRLLRLIWSDEAGPAGACARVRRLMTRQVTRERITSGFPPGVTVAAKSGALMGVARNEIAVVTPADAPACAVAVFTRTEPSASDPRAVDAAIGLWAARAVAGLTG